MKVCAICQQDKPDSAYYRHGVRGTLHAYCKPCYTEYNRAKYANGTKRTRKIPVEGERHECTMCHKMMTVNTNNFYHSDSRGWYSRCKNCYKANAVTRYKNKIQEIATMKEAHQYLIDLNEGIIPLKPSKDSDYGKALIHHNDIIEQLKKHKVEGSPVPFELTTALIYARIMAEETRLDFICRLCHEKYGDVAEDTIQVFRGEVFDTLTGDFNGDENATLMP